jgi:hypothetical protein
MTRCDAETLEGMSLKELEAVGREFGLRFSKNVNLANRCRKILARQAEQQFDDDDSHEGSSPSSPFPSQGERKPEFERLVSEPPLDATEPDTPATSRGGARPGAGRPEGMTEEIAAYERLSKLPHPGIKQALEKLFEKWSQRVRCPEVKLTKEEAVALALPWTHAYELSPIRGKIPPWLMVGIMCTWSTWAIIDTKSTIAREHAKRQRLGIPDKADATDAQFVES